MRPRQRLGLSASVVVAAATITATATPAGAAGTPADNVVQTVNDSVVYGTEHFTYTGGWGTATGISDLYDGDCHWDNNTGDTATFTFTGTEAVIHGVKDVDQGLSTYSVDAGPATTVDDYAATRSAQAALFDTGALPLGVHTVTITTTGQKNAASTFHTVAIDDAVITGPVPPPWQPVVTADLAATRGAFSPGASGSLYGIYESGVPSDNLIDGMGLQTLATKAQDGQQHPGADALEVAEPFLGNGGQDEYIYMTDVYRNFPYERTSAAQYQAYVKTEVQQVLASPDRSHIVFIPYNEPDGNWFGGMTGNTATMDAFDAEWLSTYKLIKGLDPQARIAGPNLTGYYQSAFQPFLQFCKQNGCLPDVITWHELNVPSQLRARVQAYRALEQQVGVGPLPIDINEYAPPGALDDPGLMVPWLSAITDSGVQGDLAYWQVDGSLNDSIAQQNTPNAQWWLYDWYSRMTGQSVAVSTNTDNADGTPQAVATLDAAKKQARIIVSGDGMTDPMHVVVAHVPTGVFGTSVHATVERDAWSGDTGAASAPAILSDGDLPIAADGSVTVPLTPDAMSAYQIILAPGGHGSATPAGTAWSASYEAEGAALSGGAQIQGGDTNTSGGRYVTGLRTGTQAALGFTVTVPTTGDYTLRVYDGSNGDASDVTGPTDVFVRVDGGAAQRVDLPAGFNATIWSNTATTVHLTAGRHTLSLGTSGDDGQATTGDANIDKIDLTRTTPASNTTVYEAEQAQLSGATTDYAALGQSGAGTADLQRGDGATFWVDSATDGYSTLALRATGSGAAGVAVNGQPASRLDLHPRKSGKWTTTQAAVYLQQGVNRIEVTGTAGTVHLDDLTVTALSAEDPVSAANLRTVQAESGTVTGIAKVATGYSQAHGAVVTGIGPGTGNALALPVSAPDAGTYEMTIRFANAQELPSNHYNPDLMARTGEFRVNGGPVQRVAFGPTYNWNQFFTVTVPVALKHGRNVLTFWSDQQYDLDGSTVGVVYSGTGGIGSQTRANQAANLDQFTFAPLDPAAP
jgi:hypothetical protein